MKIDSRQAHALERARELQEQGRPQRDIAKILEAEGHPPPGRSKTWNQSAVRLFLQRLNAPPAPAPPSPPSTTAVSAPAAGDPPPTASPAPASAPRRRRPLKVKIEGPWIQSDSLLWEFLVHAVWDELTTKTDHTLPLEAAVKGLPLGPIRRRDRAHLGEAVDRLTASRFRLEDEVGAQMLSLYIPLLAARLTEERLSFQFPTALIQMVKNPQQYIRLQEVFRAEN